MRLPAQEATKLYIPYDWIINAELLDTPCEIEKIYVSISLPNLKEETGDG